jgi:hypothetical protein
LKALFPELAVIVAYMDDIVLVGPPYVVAAATRWLHTSPSALASIGLSLSRGKTQFWRAQPVALEDRLLFHEELRFPASASGLSPFVHHDLGVTVWGVPIGTPTFIAGSAEEKVRHQLRVLANPIFRALPHHTAFALGRFCVYTKPRDMLRFHGEAAVAAALAAGDSLFETWFFETFLRGTRIDDPLRRRLALPLDAGGFGLRTMAMVASSALLGAFVDARSSSQRSRPLFAWAFDYPSMPSPTACGHGSSGGTVAVTTSAHQQIHPSELDLRVALGHLHSIATVSNDPDISASLVRYLPGLDSTALDAAAAARTAAIAEARQVLTAHGGGDGAGPFVPGGTQSLLTYACSIVDRCLGHHVRNDISQLPPLEADRQRANLLSCSGPHAGAWVSVLPGALTSPYSDMPVWNAVPGDQLQAMIERRLGIRHTLLVESALRGDATCPRIALSSATPSLVRASTASASRVCGCVMDVFGDHSRTCGFGPDRIQRHEYLVSLMSSVMASSLTASSNVHTSRTAVRSLMQPPPDPRTTGLARWPLADIAVVSASSVGHLFVDVTVVSSVSATAIARGSATSPGKAAALAETAKLAHYQTAMGHGPDRPIKPSRLIPAVMESGGRFGPALQGLVRGCATAKFGLAADARLTPAAADFQRLTVQRLSMCLQRIEADMVLAAAAACWERRVALDVGEREAVLSRSFGFLGQGDVALALV